MKAGVWQSISTSYRWVSAFPVGIVMYPDTSLMRGVPNDDFSQASPAQPTTVLITLAAAGRNPTDILIPTQARTNGGPDNIHIQAVGATSDGTFEAMGDGGSNGGMQQVPATFNQERWQSPASRGHTEFWVSQFCGMGRILVGFGKAA